MISENEKLQGEARNSHKQQVAGITVVLEQCSDLAFQGMDFHEKWELAQQMLANLLRAMHKAKGKSYGVRL